MKRLSILYIMLLPGTLWAQERENNLVFTRMSTYNGSQQATTTDIVQDRYGFIWISTVSGLSRYDGNSMVPIGEQADRTFSRGANCIAAVDDNIWAGSNDGLYKIDINTRRTTPVDIGGNCPVRTIFRDRSGIIWIGTNTGLVALTSDGITEYDTDNSPIANNIVRSLWQDSDLNLWIGTYNGLSCMVRDGTWRNYNFKDDYHPEKLNNLILDIKPAYPQSDSLLLIGTETGLVTFNRHSGSFTTLTAANSKLSNEVVKCIYVSGDQVWMGTNFGLNILDRRTGLIRTCFHESLLPYTLSNNVIWHIFEDSGGVLWFVTDNGLNCLNSIYCRILFRKAGYPYRDRTIGLQLRSLYIDPHGAVFAATDNGVACVIGSAADQKMARRIASHQLMPNTTDIGADAKGRLWIGTTGGINVWDPAAEKMLSFTARNVPALEPSYIAAIRRGPSGEMYVSVWDTGIYRIAPDHNDGMGRGLSMVKVSGVPTDRFVVRGSQLWILKYGRVVCVNTATGEESDPRELNSLLSGRRIECLHMSGSDILWVGTEEGLIRYSISSDRADFVEVRTVRRERVINILEDGNGVIWGTTDNTIFRIDSQGQAVTISLGADFPLRRIHPGCMALAPDGTIHCGGDDGLISFSPRELDITPFSPPVYITSIKVNNQEVEVGHKERGRVILDHDIATTDHIELNYDQRNISFEFASLHFGVTRRNRYMYMLEGFDRQWIASPWDQNKAVYSNLPPGRYNLRVRGTNNYGQWSPHEVSLGVTIQRPRMLQTWCIILYTVALLAFIFWLFRVFIKRIRLLGELRSVRLEKERSEEIMHSKTRFFTNISHEFRTPLSLIIPPLKEALSMPAATGDLRRLLEISFANGEKLLRLVNQLLDFRHMGIDEQVKMAPHDVIAIIRRSFDIFGDGAQRAGIRYVFTPHIDSLVIECDRERIEAVIYNLLSNAFKFTPNDGMVVLSIRLRPASSRSGGDSPMLEIMVSDTGVGIEHTDQESIFEDFFRSEYASRNTTGSGIGLSIVKRNVELHGGTIRVDSMPGHGSTFTVALPVEEASVAGIVASDDIIDSFIAGKREQGHNKPLILYVEDNHAMVEFVRLSLGRKYNIACAPDGRQGYEKCVEIKPLLVISDVMMPVVDGFEMSRMIRDNPSTRHIPIILLTAKSLAGDQVEGLRAGIDMYIVKPVYPEVLDAAIEQILSRRHRIADYFRQELVVVDAGTGTRSDIDKQLINNVIELIEANICDPGISVEEIGRRLGISSTHLYRRIKKLTGLGINELIRKYRLRKASLLIRENKGSISEIMYYVGFSSSSYFSKCFKAEFGVLPTEYRDQHR